MCSVADTYSKGRDIVLWSKAKTGGRHAFFKRLSCIYNGFHPPNTSPNSRPPPSVTVDLVNAKTPNASVSCYEPGEEYNGKAVKICTASSFAECSSRIDKCNTLAPCARMGPCIDCMHAASYFLAVIIRSPTYIHGILIMPLKDGLTMYSPDLVTVGAMRSPRLDRRLFMDSICSDQSVSHK